MASGSCSPTSTASSNHRRNWVERIGGEVGAAEASLLQDPTPFVELGGGAHAASPAPRRGPCRTESGVDPARLGSISTDGDGARRNRPWADGSYRPASARSAVGPGRGRPPAPSPGKPTCPTPPNPPTRAGRPARRRALGRLAGGGRRAGPARRVAAALDRPRHRRRRPRRDLLGPVPVDAPVVDPELRRARLAALPPPRRRPRHGLPLPLHRAAVRSRATPSSSTRSTSPAPASPAAWHRWC